jgi:hypothetical protein
MKRKGCLAGHPVLALNIATNIVDNSLTERVFVLIVDGVVVNEGIILRFGGNLKGGRDWLSLLQADASSLYSSSLLDDMMRVGLLLREFLDSQQRDKGLDTLSLWLVVKKGGKRYIYIFILTVYPLGLNYDLYIACISCLFVFVLRRQATRHSKRFYCVGVLNLKYFGARILWEIRESNTSSVLLSCHVT